MEEMYPSLLFHLPPQTTESSHLSSKKASSWKQRADSQWTTSSPAPLVWGISRDQVPMVILRALNLSDPTTWCCICIRCYLYECLFGDTHAHACTCGGRHQCWDPLSTFLFIYLFFRQGHLVSLETVDWLEWLSSKPLEFSFSASSVLGL